MTAFAGVVLPGIDLLAPVRKALIVLATAFTNAGAAVVSNRMLQAGTAPRNIGWGTGTTAPAVSQTTLVAEAAPTTNGGRVPGTESRTTITNANDNWQLIGTITATSGGLVITEGGVFDALTAGNMMLRTTGFTYTVQVADSVAFVFGLKFVPAVS
jgi:hypothetical protein